MLYSFSLFSVPTAILEVLLVIVPALLSVAYVTVAERKTMASMQRRVGPNKVGEKIKLIRLYKSKRFYHNSSILYNNLNIEAVKDLYKNRVALVKEFDCEVVTTCTYILKKKNDLHSLGMSPTKGIREVYTYLRINLILIFII